MKGIEHITTTIKPGSKPRQTLESSTPQQTPRESQEVKGPQDAVQHGSTKSTQQVRSAVHEGAVTESADEDVRKSVSLPADEVVNSTLSAYQDNEFTTVSISRPTDGKI